MERLTKRLSSGAPTYNYPASCYFDDDSGPDKIAQSAFRQRCVERLVDYEDSACEPEEVLPKDKADEIALKLMRLADLESLCSYTRLRELAEVDKDGRVVLLPAKTVFELTWDAGPDCDLICPVSVDGEGCCSFCDKGELCIYERKCRQEHIEEIGKTVFFTHEEAMKALEAMKK